MIQIYAHGPAFNWSSYRFFFFNYTPAHNLLQKIYKPFVRKSRLILLHPTPLNSIKITFIFPWQRARNSPSLSKGRAYILLFLYTYLYFIKRNVQRQVQIQVQTQIQMIQRTTVPPNYPVRFADKSGWKVLFVDLLWEKNTVLWQINQVDKNLIFF